jgi:hypothetical protein
LNTLEALALGARLLGLRLRRVFRRGLARKLDVFGDNRADDFTVLGASFALLREVEFTDGEEEPEDVRVVAETERAEERGGRELLLLVDVHVHDVVDVDGELDPRPAERDDARRDQALSVRMRRLFEHHTRRAVQLADDHAFGAVDHERAELRQEGQLAQVDFLLDLVLDALLPVGRALLIDREGERRLEGRGVRHVALDALFDGVLRLAKRVLLEVEREILVDVSDREQVLEDPFQTNVLAIVCGGVELQERLEGTHLDVEQMGHVHALLELSEGNLLDHIYPGSPDDRRKPPLPRPAKFFAERSEA